MTNQEIVNKLAEKRIIEDIAKNIQVSSDYYDDFVQDIYMTLLEYDNQKLNDIYEKNQIKFFIARICINNWNSKTSPFFCKYKRPLSHIDGNQNLDKLSNFI